LIEVEAEERMHALGLPEKIGASTYKENKEDNTKILLRIQ